MHTQREAAEPLNLMDTPYYPHVVLGLNNRVCVVTLNILVVHGLYTCHQSGDARLVIKALAGFYHSKPPPPAH